MTKEQEALLNKARCWLHFDSIWSKRVKSRRNFTAI